MQGADTRATIDALYEAAVIPELWPGVLDSIARQTHAALGTVFIYREGVHKNVGTPASDKLLRDYVALDRPTFNSRMHRSLARKNAGFMRDSDLFTHDELQRDEFYNDFLYPRGYGWVACSHFPLPNGDFVSVSFERNFSRGEFEDGYIGFLDDLRPHFGRAAVLSARLNLERARGMAEALNALGIPGAVIHSNGKLYAGNERFHRLIPDSVMDRRRVTLADGAADKLLADALARLEIMNAIGQSRSIPVAATATALPMIFHLLPVRGVANDIFAQSIALLIVTPVDRKSVPAAEVLQGLFDLTPSEARVARSIAEGSAIDQIANAAGVSRETVRTQLAAVLGKTGVRRQADLVAMLSGAALPREGGR
jgi:DNA-binding CsgD family transcriptional regulator